MTEPVNLGQGDLIIDEGASIDPTARFNISEYCYIGRGAKISAGCVIEGRDIRIGHELYMGEGAKIGGGSRFAPQSKLRVGHFLHMGEGAFINTARPVTIGDEVGLGMGTKVFTHGAYLSALEGFPVAFGPVTIGDNVWLPGAIVNPGVTIGNNVVVGVNSLVSKSLPSGCLAAGSPAKVIKEQAYPRHLSDEESEAFWFDFMRDYPDADAAKLIEVEQGAVKVGPTTFYPFLQDIEGPVTPAAERLRDHLRRYGIRFYCRPTGGYYESWK